MPDNKEKALEAIKCQMTIDYTPHWYLPTYDKCNKTAKYRNPEPTMGVEFVCGIHARSLNATFKRMGKNIQCEGLL